MYNLTISNRFLRLLILIGTSLVLVLSVLYVIKLKQEKILYSETKTQFTNTINSILSLQSATLSQITYDYTYWDEFIKKINNYDSVWFGNNISTIPVSYHVNYTSVYNTAGTCIHEVSPTGLSLKNFITTDMLRALYLRKFMNFYFFTNNSLVEVSCATVHPDNDPDHTSTLPQGYLFIAKTWDSKYLENLEVLGNAKAALISDFNTQDSVGMFVVCYKKILEGWNHSPVAQIIFTKEQKSLKQYHHQSLIMAVLIIATFLVIMSVFYFTTRKLVSKPLKLITDILTKEDTAKIEKLKKSHGEFRMIGQLFSDYMEQKKQLILTKDRAEESDRLKTAFLANISHEIRTPMNGIMGFVELLKEPEMTGEKQAMYIDIIEKSSARMLNTLNDLIDFSKIEAGLTKVNLGETNINEQIILLYDFFKPAAKAKGLTISYKNGLPDDEAFILTDHEKLYAIVSNLVKNAIKYTHSGSIEFGYVLSGLSDLSNQADPTTQIGSSAVEQGRSRKAGISRNAGLEFYVKDTGIGIPKNRLEAIFERFIQADIGDNRAYEGSGLGLTICKAYIEMLGGKIRVESKEENPETGVKGGSVFYFTIPFVASQEPDIKPKNEFDGKESLQGQSYQGPKLKILIAEDDTTSDKILSINLQDVSDQIIHVTTGMEAVEACRQHPDINLVMMDIKMPGLNGYEATRAIRRFNKEVIIVAQTAYALAGDREKALEAGCNEYLTKPIMKSILINLLNKIFNSKL